MRHRYLEHQLPPDQRHRYHFFNSFFLKKLQEKPKSVKTADGQGGKSPGVPEQRRLAHQRVRKWTKVRGAGDAGRFTWC